VCLTCIFLCRVKRSILQINKKCFNYFLKNKKDGNFFYKLKKLKQKQKKKIITIKFAKKGPLQNGQRQKGPQQTGRDRVVASSSRVPSKQPHY